jgi:hypothetical protein
MLSPRQFKLLQAAAAHLEELGLAREEAILIISRTLELELGSLGLKMEELDGKSRTERFAFIRTVAHRLEREIHGRASQRQIRDAIAGFMDVLRASWQTERS